MRTSVSIRIALVAASSLALTACADDRYTVQPGGPATSTALAADLHACKMASVHRFYQEGGGNGGAIGGAIGGVLGGAAGALIGIGLQGEVSDVPVPSDMNRMTEVCMRARGYEGTKARAATRGGAAETAANLRCAPGFGQKLRPIGTLSLDGLLGL